LVFNGAASPADYQALLQTVEFQSTGDNPTNFDANPARTLNWTVTDGSNDATVATTIDINAVNDPPQLTVPPTAAYTENGAPLALSPAAMVADPDNIDLIDGQVQIVAGAMSGDILTVNGLQSGTFAGIDFSYDPVLHALNFAEPSPVANYQTFIQAIEFQ